MSAPPKTSREIDRYLWLAKEYRERFLNEAEEIRVLEYVLHLDPDEPKAIEQLRWLYQKRRATEKLRLLSEDRPRLAANAARPPIPGSNHRTGSRAAGALAGLVLVGMSVLVVVANLRVLAEIPPHENAGGVVGWLAFVIPTAAITAIAFGVSGFLFVSWLRRGGTWVVLPALLSCTVLVAMFPVLVWNCIDAANVAFDPSPREPAELVVVRHRPWGKGRPPAPVAEDRDRPGSTVTLLRVGKLPVGAVVPVERGEGQLRRYYLH